MRLKRLNNSLGYRTLAGAGPASRSMLEERRWEAMLRQERAEEVVALERDGAVAIVTLNRPEARNALNEAVRRRLCEVFGGLASEPGVRAILLRGQGTAFCAGADINELEQRTTLSAAWYHGRPDTAITRVLKPVVADLHGHVLGGGLELALCCTIRVCDETLKWGFPELRLGVFPGLGGTQRLPRIVGEGHALEIILSGRIMDAQEAVRLGFVNYVFGEGERERCALELARELSHGPPIATACAIDCVRRAGDTNLAEGLDYERRMFGIVCGTKDKGEGIEAWRQKRKPAFLGH